MATKITGKKGKKPLKKFNQSVQLAAGLKKAPAATGDVAGHGDYPAYYSCWYCGHWNYVPGGIYAFYCWNCYRFNVAS